VPFSKSYKGNQHTKEGDSYKTKRRKGKKGEVWEEKKFDLFHCVKRHPEVEGWSVPIFLKEEERNQ